MIARFPWAMALLLATGPQDAAAPSLQRFRNYGQTFELDLPHGWRQLAPNEALHLSENPATPRNLRRAEPRGFYAVGPVEKWLVGDFSGPWLYIVEQPDRWYIDDDFAEQLRQSWQQETASSGVAHGLEQIHLEKVGTQAVECIVAERTSTPPPPEPAVRSLDVHAPTRSQQVTFSFTCDTAEFDRWQPEFRRWLATLTFARVAEEKVTLTDRLWTPIVTGAVVGIVLLLLYRHTRGRR